MNKADILYLVVYGNYWPLEVASIWSTKEAAQKRADELPGDWRVDVSATLEQI